MSRLPHHRAASSQPENDAASLASDVIDAFFMTTHLLHRAAERLLGGHMSGPRTRILVVVGKMAPIRMGDLAAGLGVTPRTMTTMVDALEHDGLLLRQPDPRDRRATLLTLTPAGEASINEIVAAEREISEILLAPLDVTQRQQLLELLNHLSFHFNHGLATDDSQEYRNGCM